MRRARVLMNRRGVFTAETAVLVTMGIAGLVAMSVYVQRALQGGVFGVASSIGSQYDPRNPYQETQGLNQPMAETVYQQTVQSMVAANHLPMTKMEASTDDRFVYGCPPGSGSDDPECARLERTLESLPTGRVLREPAGQLSELNANWDITTGSDYRDSR